MRSARVDARAWIFGNHSSQLIDSSRIQPEDCVIAVDKGLEYIHDLGLTPSFIIGDFDSLSRPELLDLYAHIPTIHLEPAKNATDTELAIDWAIHEGFRKITIMNDLGGRFDHALGLIQNLEAAFGQAVDCRIESDGQILFFLQKETCLDYPVGTLISLISHSSTARFASSQGLQYPLDDLLLKSTESRGISNVVTGSPAHISKLEGTVLLVLTIL